MTLRLNINSQLAPVRKQWFCGREREGSSNMKKYFVGLLVLLAFVAVAKSDKSCAFSGSEMMIPDAYDCEEVKERAEGFRFFPRFPWHRFPPLFSTLFPNFPWWPTTPDPDDDAEQCPDEGIKSIPHPKSCEKFILCVNGQELEMRCAPGKK